MTIIKGADLWRAIGSLTEASEIRALGISDALYPVPHMELTERTHETQRPSHV